MIFNFKGFKKNMEKKFTQAEEAKKTTKNNQSQDTTENLSKQSLSEDYAQDQQALLAENQKLQLEMEQIKKRNEELMYALASKENDNRRLLNEIENEKRKALQKFTKSISVSFDDLLRILKNNENDAIRMVFNKLMKALEENHLHIITPKKGDVFDPQVHNAISSIQSNEMPNGTIADVLSSCYKVYDQVVNTAMVVVVNNEC